MNSYRMRNPFSILGVTVFVIAMLIIISVTNAKLRKKLDDNLKREAYNKEMIAAQEKRAEEIEEYRIYMHTKQYVEDMAREKLGLVYKDEIILEAEN